MPTAWADRFSILRQKASSPDVSFGAPALDSFFAPEGPLAHAQELAAEAFGAQAALFGTCGTTVSNRIVLDALSGRGARVLIDGTSHQSVLFTARSLGIQARAIDPLHVNGSAVPNLAQIESELNDADNDGHPYDVMVITASSYDGYLVKLDEVIPRLIAASPLTAIIIDAAWTAIHAFASPMRRHTAFGAVARLREAGIPIPPIIVTTSAHKSLCALRQGALILVANGIEHLPALRSAQFMHHTTSPSWPILASIDLACAHATECGEQLFNTAVKLRSNFIERVRSDPALMDLVSYRPDTFSDFPGVAQDPMKLLISTAPLGDPTHVRRILFSEHDIYVSRCNGKGLLLNFTVGVTENDVDALVNALRALIRSRQRHTPRASFLPSGAVVSEYIVPYPPGIPIARPGDVWTASHARTLNNEVAAGAEIFRLPEFTIERTPA